MLLKIVEYYFHTDTLSFHWNHVEKSLEGILPDGTYFPIRKFATQEEATEFIYSLNRLKKEGITMVNVEDV